MAANKMFMLVRGFSTGNICQQMVKPLVQVFGIEGRYATALYSAASKEKKLDAVERELVKLQASIKTEEKLREFLANPTIKRNVKSDALKNVAAKISLSSQSSNLLQLLAENGRLNNINGVINAYKTIMAAHRGEIACEVTTAKELDASQRMKLEGVLKTFVKSNQTIQVTAKVDPSIIGGMIVSVGDRYVDMSVAAKLKKYTEIISASV